MQAGFRKIIIWIFIGIISLLFIGNGVMKLSGLQPAIEMASRIGIGMEALKILGVMEIFFALLFLIPKYCFLGFLLLSAYLGGAIATHVLVGDSLLFPIVVQLFLWITIYVRFPILFSKIFKLHRSI